MYFLPSVLILLILALVQLVLLSKYFTCFYDDKIDSHSSSARVFSIGLWRMPLACDTVVILFINTV